MAIGDTPNQNLFGTNYNAEEEEEKKAELAAQGAMMGAAGVPASAFGQAPAVNPFSMEAAGQVNPMMKPQSLQAPLKTPNIVASATPTIDSILNSGIGTFQPGAIDFLNPPTVDQTMLEPATYQTTAAPKDFNLNNFLGKGSSSNFGNFGDISSPSDLFSVNAESSNPFAIDSFAGSAFNSPEVDVSLIGFQEPQDDFGQEKQNQPISFQDIESQMTSSSSQPIISSTPSPGLEPFNRYNFTTQQFEQMFGNKSALLPSAETFVEGKTGFNDEPRFLQSIRDEAQENALNFIGQPVTQKQLDQANRLAEEIGVTSNFQVDANGNLITAEYGTDFKQRSPEEFNRLLNMRNIQKRQASVNTPEFKQAMAERDAPLQESRASYQKASDERIDRLRNQPGLGDTFNYDKDGNKVLAGGSAGSKEMSQSEARDIAAGEARGANAGDVARGLLVKSRVNNRLKNIELDKSANAVQNFFAANNIGKELNTGDVRMLIEATGSPQEAIRAYGNLLESLSKKELNNFTRELGDMNAYGMELETPSMFKKLDDKTTRMLALSTKTGEWGYVKDREFIPVNIDDYRETAYSEISTARKNALNLQTEVFTDVSGIEQLKKFKADRIDSQEGLPQFITSIQDRFKTAFGMPISEQGMKDAIAKAGFERLLGVIRLDVLGPGVLTEQDAQRLIAAMGGFGGLADRETSVKLVERLIKSKEKAAQGRMTVYNQTRRTFKELENELPNMTMDNVESVRKGDFLNPNNSSDLKKQSSEEIESLFTNKS